MLLPIVVVVAVLSRIKTAVAENYCEIPEDPENGEVIYTTLTLGSELTFECYNGYHLQDTEPVFCTWDGEWSNTDVKCVARSCSTPKDPEHGQVFYTTLHVRSELTFECENGYHMQDTEPVYCTSDGEWSKTDVKCVPITCDIPEQLKNGRVIFTSVAFRSRLKFKCDDGYFLNSYEPVFCTSDGIWSKADVQCVAENCDRPEHLKNGEVDFTSLNVGSQLKFKCDDGYLLNINEPVFCMSDGIWNMTDVRCVSEEIGECSVPWIWNGNIEEPQSIYNDTRIFYENVPVGSVRLQNSTLYLVCQNDHLVIGLGVSRTSINCFKGKWTPDPVCRKKDCSVPWISNGNIEEPIIITHRRFNRIINIYEDGDAYKLVPVGSIPPADTTLFLVCQQNHLVLGLNLNTTKITCSEGKWTPPPVCLKRSCTVPFIPNGRLERLTKVLASLEHRYQFEEVPVGRRAEDGEVFSFLCDRHYRPEDSISEYSTSVSCKDGKWSERLRCKPSYPVESISVGDKGTTVSPSNSKTPNPISSKEISSSGENECFCIYNNPSRLLYAKHNRILLRYGAKVKKGHTITLRCNDPAMHFVLPNGTRSTYESLLLTCSVCEIWGASLLPTCQNWRSPDITCRELNWSDLMSITYTNNRRVGSFANFDCSAPGIRSGVARTRCLENGQWQDSPPTCMVIMCRDLKESDLMSITYSNNRRVGSIANFHCLAPWIRSGVARTVCLENGEWQDSSPTCSAPTCLSASLSEIIPQIVIHKKDDVTSSIMPYNSTVKLMCRNGENLVGNSFARCGSEGNWEVGDIRCISGCPPFVTTAGSRLVIKPKKDAYRFGEFVILSCLPGYELSMDVQRVMCLQIGWSTDTLPECVELNVSDK